MVALDQRTPLFGPIAGDARLLAAVREAGERVARFVEASS